MTLFFRLTSFKINTHKVNKITQRINAEQNTRMYKVCFTGRRNDVITYKANAPEVEATWAIPAKMGQDNP